MQPNLVKIKSLIIIWGIILSVFHVLAQEPTYTNRDTLSLYTKKLTDTPSDTLTKVVIDSTVIFDKLQQYNTKTKLGRLINKLVYKNNKKLVAKAPEIKTNQHFNLGEGKIIRNVEIVSLAPFGYSDSDSLKHPTSKLDRIGNKLHINTRQFAIRNFLLFKEGQTFDSLKIKESERLIRTQRFARAVSIYAITDQHSDSVDVQVRVLDAWTIFPSGSISTSSMRLKLIERNFAGLGHEMILQYNTRLDENKQGYYFNYRVNNIQNTFIRTQLTYDSNVWGNYVKYIAVDRQFYSPYAKWAGGVSISQNFRRDSLPDKDMNYNYEPLKYNVYDAWGGYSVPLLKKYKDQPIITNLRGAIRYIKQDFTETPQFAYDTIGYYKNQQTFLASISINSINYVQDKFIFNYDLIEDVQIGKVFALTAGVREQYNKTRMYYGAKFAIGAYSSLGYFAGNLQWGSYFYKGASEQGALRFNGTYFTKLFVAGKWRFRHFLTPELVIGYNRIEHIGDYIGLEPVIEGIRASKIKGLRRLSVGYQWQSYAPYEWKGFRFNPFFSAQASFMGYKGQSFLNPKLYSRLSLGFVANNDYLVFSRIAISLVYYPTMPDSEKPIFYANSRDYNIDLQDLNYNKPSTITYY